MFELESTSCLIKLSSRGIRLKKPISTTKVLKIETKQKTREGRLQRKPKGGQYISSFRQVFLRHGMIMTAIALICVFSSQPAESLSSKSIDFLSRPVIYVAASGLIILFFVFFLYFIKRAINVSRALWVGYLLSISIVEEIAFRFAMPLLLAGVITNLFAILISNLLFAGLHYFTLRWKPIPCFFTFLGGLGFARLLDNTENIVLVILVHWLVTFLNTPVPPSPRAD